MGCRVNPVKLALNFAEYNAKLATESTKRDIETLRDITGKLTGRFGQKLDDVCAIRKYAAGRFVIRHCLDPFAGSA
jgi:hypothetical protein